jgi:coenzyme F420-reducing hydrogenase alpha subunit
MGFLTTITIYNDGVGDIERNPKQFGEEVVKAIHSNAIHGATEIGVGCFANIAKVQRSRHADNPAVYVHLGNTLAEMTHGALETEKLFQKSPEYFEKLLTELKYQTRKLKKDYGPKIKAYHKERKEKLRQTRKLNFIAKLK